MPWDVEKKVILENMVSNLSINSNVNDYKRIVRQLGDMYKEKMADVLSGSTTPTLATERADAETDIAALVTEFDQDTSKNPL